MGSFFDAQKWGLYKQESTVDLLLDVDQRPSAGKGILLSFSTFFAMFGATILVPLILGMPISVALFASDVGTLIFSTGFKSSSLSRIILRLYHSHVPCCMKEWVASLLLKQGLLTGLIYVVVATSVRFAGTKMDWQTLASYGYRT